MPKTSPQRNAPHFNPGGNVARRLSASGTGIVPLALLADAFREKRTVNPYIEEDVDNARREPLKVWVEAVLGLPPERFSEWVRHIKENEWYKDEMIQGNLIDFSNASLPAERYTPFANIVNRILQLGKDELPRAESYPLDDIVVIRNDPNFLKLIPEHQGLGAYRIPDLLAVRASKIVQMKKAKSKYFEWSDVLTFFEMKFSNRRTLLPKVPSKKKTVAGTKMTLRARPLIKYSDEKGLYYDVDSESDDADDIDVDEPHDEDYNGPGSPKPVRDTEESMKSDAKLQAGGYALETVACSYGTRLFTTGIVIEDDKMSLWYYDAAGIIRTKASISLLRNFEEFAAILVGFACCTPSQWGSLPSNIIKPPRLGPDPEVFPPKNLSGYTFPITLPKSKEEILATLKKPVFTQYSLVGRRTFLYVIKTNSPKLKNPMVAKFSYQVTSRKREQDIIEVASNAGVGHLPEVHMWADYWKMSEGVRAIFHARSGVDEDFEDRVFRCIVYTQYFPLRDLFSKSCELIPTMVYQMLDCLHDLRYKAKILHRDISANNVMWEKQGDEVVFKLIDFDCAAFVDDQGRPLATTASSKHRTGTLPFMAYALIMDMVVRGYDPLREPVDHMLCHDVESLYYLSGYSMVTMPDMKHDVKRAIYRNTVSVWEDGSLDAISAQKMHFLQEDKIMRIFLPPQSQSLRPWLLRFCEVFKEARYKFAAYRKGSSDPFDLETVGGTLSRESIMSVLKGEENIIFREALREKVVVPPEASGSGASNVKTAEGTTNEGKAEAKKSAPAKRAPAKKAPKKDTEGKKTATAKIVTPKKMTAAKASQVKDVASKAKLAAAPEVVTIQGLTRGPTTRSMTKKALISR
ncbi:hypothetical protein EW026_g5535 [Hermanssonia centrifuga]|uniref:Protein kinase domain-containing protein n=1 Tax=Hermanssonia centrifuga TaxID=98765 RepID=A0A4S4KI58_9APHY|nr:hypothetical protein EW026_g5535 [Hermanssonia centrifuga]